MRRDQRGGVGLLCEAGRVLRGPGSSVAHFCSTVTPPLLPMSPSPRSPLPPDVCARGLLSRAFEGSLLTVPRLGPKCKLSSTSEGHCSPVRVSSLLLGGLVRFLTRLLSPLCTRWDPPSSHRPDTYVSHDRRHQVFPHANKSIAERRLHFPHGWTWTSP